MLRQKGVNIEHQSYWELKCSLTWNILAFTEKVLTRVQELPDWHMKIY